MSMGLDPVALAQQVDLLGPGFSQDEQSAFSPYQPAPPPSMTLGDRLAIALSSMQPPNMQGAPDMQRFLANLAYGLGQGFARPRLVQMSREQRYGQEQESARREARQAGRTLALQRWQTWRSESAAKEAELRRLRGANQAAQRELAKETRAQSTKKTEFEGTHTLVPGIGWVPNSVIYQTKNRAPKTPPRPRAFTTTTPEENRSYSQAQKRAASYRAGIPKERLVGRPPDVTARRSAFTAESLAAQRALRDAAKYHVINAIERSSDPEIDPEVALRNIRQLIRVNYREFNLERDPEVNAAWNASRLSQK